jgi:Putative metal-binding motif/FG-GAP repeat/FG-GAP-like repeat
MLAAVMWAGCEGAPDPSAGWPSRDTSPIQGPVARVPATTGPLDSTPSARLAAADPRGQFGLSLAAAGDVNGDGFDDVAVGACQNGVGSGAAYLYVGSATGAVPTPAATLPSPLEEGDLQQCALAGAGDVDADGFDDLIVGIYYNDPDELGAFVFHGAADGLRTASTAILYDGDERSLAPSVSGAGDVNNDGHDDVIVGYAEHASDVGQARVHLGSSTGIDATPIAVLDGHSVELFAYSVAGAGDINGDGFGDIVAGAPWSDSQTGKAYTYHGDETGVATVEETTVTGEFRRSEFGVVVDGAGDVNGDGYGDVVAAAPSTGRGVGRVYVYLGSSTGMASTANDTPTGTSEGDYFGNSVAGAGDVDNDGFDDIIIGAPGVGVDLGRAYLFPGSADGLAEERRQFLPGEEDQDRFGLRVSSAGDMNGGGFGDVLVAAPGHDNDRGIVYVFHGYVDADGDGVPADEDCDDTDATVYPGAIEVPDDGVDQDCDGADDTVSVGETGVSSETGTGHRASAEGCAGCAHRGSARPRALILGLIALAVCLRRTGGRHERPWQPPIRATR